MFNTRLGRKTHLVTPDDALAGSDTPLFELATTHLVLGTSMLPPFPAGSAQLYVGMGCFWGAEKKFWRLPGVITTAAGYQGGVTKNPTYEQVCSGRTGHAENVLVVYNPELVSTYDVLKVFWENHDPTQGYRQGNDVGTQYRSTLYWTDDAQGELVVRSRDAFDEMIRAKGYGEVTTELAPAADLPFWYAEPHHQQYLYSNPGGYDCHSSTGLTLPPLG
jgi:peptide-methionine (S)-S-oxide reductase